MPTIQVSPSELQAAGTDLRTTGTQIQQTAGGLSQATAALPAACGDADAGAACQEMGDAVNVALLESATDVQTLGDLVASAADEYALIEALNSDRFGEDS